MAQNNQRNGGNNGSAPKVSINVTPSSQDLGDKVQMTFEVSVFNGAIAMAGQSIVLMDGVSRIAQPSGAGVTGTNGVGVLQIEIPLSDKEQQKMLRVSLDGRPETFSFPVLIPAKKKTAAANNGAESLVAMKYQREDGLVNFKLRLLKNNGEGIANHVITVWYHGENYNIKTDKQGEALFSGVIQLLEGDEEEIIFATSGIKKEAKMTLRRRAVLNQPNAFSRRWWLRTNNGRAFILFLVVILLWFLAFRFGPGAPLVGENLFNDEEGYSAMERYYNETAAKYGRAIEPTDNSNDFIFFGLVAKKKIWIYAVLFTVLFLIYFPIAAREEIAEAIEDIKVKMVDRQIVRSDDPFFERLVASAASVGLARNTSPGDVQFGPVASSTAPHPEDLDRDGKKDKKSFMGSFWSFLSLDLVGDLVIGIIKRVFNRH